jgi:uncharacterized protein
VSETVRNNEAKHRYELDADGATAIAAYRVEGDRIFFTHTEVPAVIEGRGIGSRLIKGAFEDVRRLKLRVVAQCSFVSAYLRKHPEERDVEG